MNKNEQNDILVFARDTAQPVQLKEQDLKESLLTKVIRDS